MINISTFIMLISLLFKNSTAASPTPSPTIMPKLSPIPIVTNMPLPSPTPSPTSSPTPSPILQKSPTPKPVETKASNIMEKINTYRADFGLAPVSEDPQTCAYAQLRANELVNNFSHDGTDYPYTFSEVTENIARTSNPNEVVDLWINSPSHAENMRKNTPYVCVRNSGSFYAYEGWRP